MIRFIIVLIILSSNAYAYRGYDSLGLTYESTQTLNESTYKFEFTREFIDTIDDPKYMWGLNLGEHSYGAELGIAKYIGINIKLSLGLDYSPNILEEDYDRLYWTPRFGFDWALFEFGFGEYHSFNSKESVDGKFSYINISIPFWAIERMKEMI